VCCSPCCIKGEVIIVSSIQQAASQKTGAVLVIGGGIGGIQAALDLAESGYYVYLVEQSPAIGGVMAQLERLSLPMIVLCASFPRNWWSVEGIAISRP
jgi:heterodisulfide reductase subunit A-like polyferredoxin